MSDDSATPTSLDARRTAAVREIAKRLVAMGVNPDASKQRAEAVAERLNLGGKGPIRVLLPFSSGEFYPGSFEDPLAPLVNEIFYGIPDDEKLVATKQREKNIEELSEQKARSGQYRI